MGAGISQFFDGQAFVFGALFGRKHIPPTAVRALVDEGLGTAIPEFSPERGCEVGVLLHVFKGAMPDYLFALFLRNIDLREIRDAGNARL